MSEWKEDRKERMHAIFLRNAQEAKPAIYKCRLCKDKGGFIFWVDGAEYWEDCICQKKQDEEATE